MNSGPGKPAVVLLSGGMDSAVVLAIAREHGFAAHVLAWASRIGGATLARRRDPALAEQESRERPTLAPNVL